MKLEYHDYESAFTKLLKRYKVGYNPVSLIEAKWIILRHSKRSPEKRVALLQSYRKRLLSLEKDERVQGTIITSERMEELSDALLTKHNVRDYFDRQIYSCAAELQCILLTEDNTLHDLMKKKSASAPKEALRWKELLNRLED